MAQETSRTSNINLHHLIQHLPIKIALIGSGRSLRLVGQDRRPHSTVFFPMLLTNAM